MQGKCTPPPKKKNNKTLFVPAGFHTTAVKPSPMQPQPSECPLQFYIK